MYLAYMDESGDPGAYIPPDPEPPGWSGSPMPRYTVAVVLINDSDWVRFFDRLVAFRRWLRDRFGFQMRAELKGSDLAKGSGPWEPLGHNEKALRFIYRTALRFQARSGVIKTCAVSIDKERCEGEEDVREKAWSYALNRVERFCRNNDTAMILPDSGQYAWVRKLARRMRRFATVGSLYGTGSLRADLLKVLVEDPVERDSNHSYLIQLADLNAYAAFRNQVPIPQFPSAMWEELGTAILWQANRRRLERDPTATRGIVDGP